MKARIKATGEILEIAKYSTIAMENCDSYGTPLQYLPEEIEFIDDTIPQEKIDWEQRRFDLVKAAMQGFCSNSAYVANNDATVDIAAYAVSQADAVLAEYKKGGNK